MRVHFYTILLDEYEALGYILSIFSKQRGHQIVYSSQVQKQNYQEFLAKREEEEHSYKSFFSKQKYEATTEEPQESTSDFLRDSLVEVCEDRESKLQEAEQRFRERVESEPQTAHLRPFQGQVREDFTRSWIK